MKYYQQFDESDCGAACLAMVASYYGKILNIARIREIAGTDLDGTNLKGLLQAARTYNLRGKAVKGMKESINKNILTPFIVHLKILSNDSVYYHYAVIKKNKQIKNQHMES